MLTLRAKSLPTPVLYRSTREVKGDEWTLTAQPRSLALIRNPSCLPVVRLSVAFLGTRNDRLTGSALVSALDHVIQL